MINRSKKIFSFLFPIFVVLFIISVVFTGAFRCAIQIIIAIMSVNTSVAVPKCYLHLDSYADANGRIILFNETTIQKCREKKDIRSRLNRKSKFSNIILPDEIDGTTGYHSGCYKSYCAVGFPKASSSSSIESSVSTAGETANDETDDEETTQSENSISDSK